MTYLLASFLLLNLTFAPSQTIYRFDAGEDAISEGYEALSVSDLYSVDTGFGWTRPPESAFERPADIRFREPELLDGVQGQAIGFRADVPEGRWWITLWMEAGLESVNTATLTLNDKATPLGWNPFDRPAEPRTSIQDIYRVLHKPVDVGEDGLQFELIGQADAVRILAFTVSPDPPSSPENTAFLERLNRLGSYTTMLYDPGHNEGSVFETLQAATEELRVLRREIAEHPDPLFAAYWAGQLDLLIKGEDILARRGWGWANTETGLSLFARIHQGIMILDGLLDRPDAASFPFYERALFARGRLLYWLKVEGSSPQEIAGVRRHEFEKLYALYPQDSLLAMYNGVQIDLPDACDIQPESTNAPEWARVQHDTLCRLRDIAHWWVTEQQAENGEFGGKFGDDVELLRWWPALILSGDTLAYSGWKRLADGVWHSGRIKNGYAKNVSDVEHASEFVSDTAPVMALFTDDPLYTQRLQPSAHYFDSLWTGVTPTGQRFFKSAWFSSSEIDAAPPKNRDVGYNTRAAKAVRYYAWKTEDAHVIDLLSEWSASWAAVAMGTDKGKPAGVIPPSVRFPDGSVNGDEPNWYEANMYWSYFDWKGHAGSMTLDQLLFSYTQTHNEALLQPLYAGLSLIRAHHEGYNHGERPEPGSPEWAAHTLMSKARFWSVVSQWRLYTGDTQFDDVLIKYGTPYLRYRLTGDEEHLLNGLHEILEKVRFNTPMLTYEAIHTDRIYVTNSGSGSSHLKAMVTGDGIIEDMSPYPTVTWEQAPSSMTVLVGEASSEVLEVSMYIFEEGPVDITGRLWQLPEGTYTMTLLDDSGEVLESGRVVLTSRGERFTVSVPGGQLVRLRVE